MSGLRENISAVLAGYLKARTEDLTRHEMAVLIKKVLPIEFGLAINDQRLKITGGCGIGNWAKGPWVGIFNPVVTTSAQNGYYVCLLFKEDMTGAYLSLNQGMTEAKKNYKSDAKTALRARASNFRALLGKQFNHFPEVEIDLAPSSKDNDTAFYEAGNICAKFYARNNLPSEDQIAADLKAMLKLYEALIVGETDSDVAVAAEDDAPSGQHHEDASRFRMHKRIERNVKLSGEVKKQQGYTCQVCQLNFEKRYGSIGKDYIEAHHLIPLASIKGTKVTMDPMKDFAVLCANCHRMIHRSGCVDDIEKFKAEHFHA